MSQNDFKVSKKAQELLVHTYKLTSNSDRYPKKYRHSLADRMQLLSMDIYETLIRANRTSNLSSKRLRCEYITQAITCCDFLLKYIELSVELGILSIKSAKYWSELASDVKHLSLGWRKSEQK